MGTSNSCLPVKFSSFYPCHRRHIVSSRKSNHQEPVHNNGVNINQVSEDELLLLPGINRQLASNIVQYRHINHGFKHIHEVLQVDGITSNIFKRIYTDITINSSSSDNKKELINLNLASYNELCSVPGLTSNLVTRIIQRRERKGSFRFIEDLLKIKGIDYIILATVRPHVTVDQQQIPTSITNSSFNNLHPTDTLSIASLLLQTLPPEFQTRLISSSPQLPSPIHDNNKGRKTFRFASWNLQQLTNDKVQNPGVREVICRIILGNK